MVIGSAFLAVILSLSSAVCALPADRHPAFLKIGAFTLLALAGIAAIVAGAGALFSNEVYTLSIPLGLPWLNWHLRLDALSGFFLIIIGLITVAVALYGPGHVREFEHGPQSLGVLGLFTGLFMAGMLLVVLAADGFAFMVAWEVMSLSSYFLVAYQHQHAANRRAAYLYLVMAHIGGLSILLGFGVLAGFGGGLTFEAMREAVNNPGWSAAWAGIAFVLALFGFGMKAGLVPLHVWLPEAHPVAPSHISALMSGVMLKVAVYGFIRFVFDLVGGIQWEWGLLILILGSASAVLGVLYALVQHDLKRLLAYHSVENIGIIFIGLGLSMVFAGTGHPVLAALGLIAALYHCLNHAIFKSLLFMGAGAIHQHSHERNLERMGGLIRRMPYTAFFFLIGSVSIAALPPFNGFVSEWLTFQAALQASALESGVLRAVIPIAAASLALAGALAAACFVKVFGVVFLGRARTRHVRHAHDPSWGMRAGQAWLAVLCLVLGILPTFVVQFVNVIPERLLGSGLPGAASRGWLWLTPVSAEVASYGAPMVLAGLAMAWGIGYWLLHPRGRRVIRRAIPWDCGFGPLSTRMQYSATAFAMPIRRVFQPAWRIKETVERRRDKDQPLRVTALSYLLHVEDWSFRALYEPIGRWVRNAARRLARIQTGNIRTYLAYSFFTLLILLWMVSVVLDGQ